jgi:hypothetical protein
MLKINQNVGLQESHIEASIRNHISWKGFITGLEAEAFFKNQKPHSFLLREGEKLSNYYISYVSEDGCIRHQPFAIFYTQNGWYCQQGRQLGPYSGGSIDDIVHWIIHCEKGLCLPIK